MDGSRDLMGGKRRAVRPREAREILTALEAGIVPRIGVQHLLVGRQPETEEIIDTLKRVQEGASDMKIWVGDFGSGKSFMLRTIEQIALSRNFVTSTVDLNPTRCFQSSNGKALALYQEVINRLQTRGAGEGEAMASIFEQWIEGLASELGLDILSLSEAIRDANTTPDEHADFQKLKNRIYEVFNRFRTGGLSYELSQCLVRYAEGMVSDSALLKTQALRWVGGRISTKTESKRELGIGQIPTDDNWTDLLQNLCEFFIVAGYDGLVVNFDEVVNLYKLPHSLSREKNYERTLNLYNDCKSGAVPGLFLNLAATRKTIYDEYRGMASYGALKGRLGIQNEDLEKLVNTTATLQFLKPLTNEDIFTLLGSLQEIFHVSYPETQAFKNDDIQAFMEAQLNRPGADEFLTPRAVIKDFIQLMQLARQNPDLDSASILEQQFGSYGQVYKDADNHDDEIPGIEVI